jgi:hypothetical protein
MEVFWKPSRRSLARCIQQSISSARSRADQPTAHHPDRTRAQICEIYANNPFESFTSPEALFEALAPPLSFCLHTFP